MKIKTGMGGSRCGKSRREKTATLKKASKKARRAAGRAAAKGRQARARRHANGRHFDGGQTKEHDQGPAPARLRGPAGDLLDLQAARDAGLEDPIPRAASPSRDPRAIRAETDAGLLKTWERKLALAKTKVGKYKAKVSRAKREGLL